MLARTQLDHLIRISARASILLGILFLVTVLLAAMPGHHVPAAQSQESQQSSSAQSERSQQSQQMDPNMRGMDMDDAKANEAHAVHDMTPGHMDAHSLHMHMTSMRPQTSEDAARAKEIVGQLRSGIEKYKDYHVALNDGYKIFLPKLPQPEYHFTNYKNGFLEAFTFDPARPTSLLYKKTSDGYELVGAMYTMPKRATEDQLNARVPLSVAMWHLHTNLCMPPKGQLRNADWTKFGLRGSIATEEACDAAGGRFHPVIFGWMVHVYPYEDSADKIFAMHHHD
ncbi:MAG TPA: hypothetical protein VE263_21705 [Candidatus Angelobacter sp.]|nr:hypothetical protein [Candidatus Angelobacter sp.]